MKKGALILISVSIIFFLFVSTASAVYETNKTAAFLWLENRTVDKNWTRSLTTEQFAFSFLALDAADRLGATEQAAVFNLSKKGSNGCWPAGNCNVRDTALAKMMLDSAGNSSELADEWLLNKTIPYAEVSWYLQVFTEDEDIECMLGYDGNLYGLNVTKDDKVKVKQNPCLSVSDDYWLKLDPGCVNKTFSIACLTDFKGANFLFKNNSDWYLPGAEFSTATSTSPYSLSISIPYKTSCIGLQGCDYEATAWTAFAFAFNGQKSAVRNLIPYLILEKDGNERFLPEAFLYALGMTGVLDELEENQGADGLWRASGSAYNEFYDTALVGFMTSRQAGNWSNAEKTLFSKQTKTGYWSAADAARASIVRDTAMILLALQTTAGEISECYAKGYDCVDNCSSTGGIPQTFECPTGKECCYIDYGDQECEAKGGTCRSTCETGESNISYACPAGAGRCCIEYGSMTCSQLNGTRCSSGQKCVKNGIVIPFAGAKDGDCCLGTCVTPTKNCSELNGTVCKTSEGKSCVDGKWLPSTDDQCCMKDACHFGVLTCNEIGGDVCEEGQFCKGGSFVIAKDTADSCCIDGGRCIFENCPGDVCATGEACNGTEVEAEDADSCCIDGACIPTCASKNGVPCVSPKVCSERISGTNNPDCCKQGKCSEKKAFPWLILIFIMLALALVVVLFMKKRKKKEKPKIAMPGMMPPGRMARPGIFRRSQAAPMAPARRPVSRPMPKMKQAFPLKKPGKPASKPTPEKKKAVLEELEKISKE